MTMNLENLEAFKGRFEEAVSSVINPEQLIPSLEVDLTLEFDQITKKLFENINRLAPFGPQNMRPTFVSHNVYDTGKSRVVGADNSHLKLEVYQKGNAQSPKKGIAFGLAKHLEKMQQGHPFSLVYVLEENVFNGYTNLELMVKDIRFTTESTDKSNPV
jgi:single-stranded-DNA-specific exonuclease